ncbi:anti-sigma B factor antagonist [Sinobacterium caligoides]|uniref:Anti-sigma factor antagonist n=1 Tax=Sinobacterium caligoides TaxID=933926 RepID=A0A3N2DH12_9GAMM|nr:STAS domain-containing protein [Sinobacterium caligoides]ROR99080.1 anti-sigma B factor antagonist [Sinobacterium caligoides]
MAYSTTVLDSDSTLLVVKSHRIDASTAGEFQDYVASVIKRQGGVLILDISRVDFMDSTGLGALVSLLKMFDVRDDMRVVGAQTLVKDLMRLTRMDRIFKNYETVESALAS